MPDVGASGELGQYARSVYESLSLRDVSRLWGGEIKLEMKWAGIGDDDQRDCGYSSVK